MEGLRQIDRYRLIEEIGSGGMAVVYKGLDTALDREVAVKIMHPHLANKEESRRRFSREARAVARLRHPYILEIYDFSGDEARESYIVTEFVKGCTLRTFGDEVGFPLPEIAAMAIDQLAEALAAAHDAGIVHRDLKPENVMVRDDGLLKLMDFGIARIIEKDEKMTMTGALVGSPMHMAPEVIEGKEADVRADIFALGTIFHWMVTGEMAFQGGSTHDTLRRILEGDYTDARMLKAECSDEIAELIGRCLKREPSERFQTVTELREALRPVLEEAGLGQVETELKAFFADAPGYSQRLRPVLVERLVVSGEAALESKRSARALSLFNRVLALDPDNAAVADHLARMNRAKRRQKLLKQLAVVALGLVATTAAGAAVRQVVLAWPKPAPVVEAAAAPVAAAPERAVVEGPVLPVDEHQDETTAANARRSARRREESRQLAAATVESLPPVPPRHVKLHWNTGTASLHIGNQDIPPGISPDWEGEVPAGTTMTVTLTSKYFRPETKSYPIPRDGTDPLDFRISLKPAEAMIHVDTDRPEGIIIVDGERVGSVHDFNQGGGHPVAMAPEQLERLVTVRLEPPPDAKDLFNPVARTVKVTAGTTTPAALTVGDR